MLGDAVADRLTLDITLFLALVALNFAVAGFIPRVSYSTSLSSYFVVSYALLTFSTLHNVVIYFVNYFYCTIGGPSSGIVTTAPTRCWTALYYDWGVLALIAIGMISYTLFFVINGKRNRTGEIVHKIHQVPGPSIYDDPPIHLE